MRRNANDSPTTHSPARQPRPPRCARPCQHPQGLSRPIQEKPHSVALHSAAARALLSIAASDPDRWPGRAQTEAPCSRRTRVPQTLCRASSLQRCVLQRDIAISHQGSSLPVPCSRLSHLRELSQHVLLAPRRVLTSTVARPPSCARGALAGGIGDLSAGMFAVCALRCAVPPRRTGNVLVFQCVPSSRTDPCSLSLMRTALHPGKQYRRTSLAHRHSVEPLQTALYAPSMSVATERAADIPIATLLDRTQSRQTESGRTRRITLGGSGPPHLALPRKPFRVHRPAQSHPSHGEVFRERQSRTATKDTGRPRQNAAWPSIECMTQL